MEMQRLELELRGTSPLILNNICAPPSDSLRVDFENKKFRDTDDRECVPSMFFKSCFMRAARTRRLKLRRSELASSFVVEGPELLPLKFDECAVHSAMLSVPHADRNDVLIRPMYKNWSVPLTMQFRTDVLSEVRILEIVVFAGRNLGRLLESPESRRLRLLRARANCTSI